MSLALNSFSSFSPFVAAGSSFGPLPPAVLQALGVGTEATTEELQRAVVPLLLNLSTLSRLSRGQVDALRNLAAADPEQVVALLSALVQASEGAPITAAGRLLEASPPQRGEVKPIRRIFVPNRGEAASRLIAAARELSAERGERVEVVVMYTDADKDAPFVADADIAIHIPPHRIRKVPDLDDQGRPRLDREGHPKMKDFVTYLDMDLIRNLLNEQVGDLRSQGFDASALGVWPGWGFLAETEELSTAVSCRGATFIGPPPEAIWAVGDKIGFKRLADPEGLTWSGGAVESAEEALRVAGRLGYPVVVKATAGGGGKGIKFAGRAEELPAKLSQARQEAQRAFNNPTVFVERAVVPSPGRRVRHIEVQILADRYGNVVVVGDRDCSLQRANQKVVEEAPAPGLTEEQRAAIHAAAIRIVRGVGYMGAGTVEGLFVPEEGIFQPMELNARLQVEHTITEAVTGVDLVKEMIRIAEGHSLSLSATPRPRGVAFEVRINAEDTEKPFDPEKGFDATSGTLRVFRPPTGPGIRIDTGVRQGSAIQAGFDPMVAKLIVCGASREEAIARAKRALRDFAIDGVRTNRGFALEVLGHPTFAGDQHTTKWLEEYLRSREPWTAKPFHPEAILAAAALAKRAQEEAYGRHLLSTFARGRPHSLPRRDESVFLFRLYGHVYETRVFEYSPGLYRVETAGRVFEVRLLERGPSEYEAEIDGHKIQLVGSEEEGSYALSLDGTSFLVERPPSGNVTAPFNGTVRRLDPASNDADAGLVAVNPGDMVTEGQVIAKVESMKLEQAVKAPTSGRLEELLFSNGQAVRKGDIIARINKDVGEPKPPQGPPIEFRPRREFPVCLLASPDPAVADEARRTLVGSPNSEGAFQDGVELLRQAVLAFDPLSRFFAFEPRERKVERVPSAFSGRFMGVLETLVLERGVTSEALGRSASQVLSGFVDVELLFQRGLVDPRSGRSMADHFYDFLRTRKVEVDPFREMLKETLPRYGIRSLAPSPERDHALAEMLEWESSKEWLKKGLARYGVDSLMPSPELYRTLVKILEGELFYERFKKALAHYGVNSFEASPQLDRALAQILLTREEKRTRDDELLPREEIVQRFFGILRRAARGGRLDANHGLSATLEKFSFLDRELAPLTHSSEGLLFMLQEARQGTASAIRMRQSVDQLMSNVGTITPDSDEERKLIRQLADLPAATGRSLLECLLGDAPQQARIASAAIAERRYGGRHDILSHELRETPAGPVSVLRFRDGRSRVQRSAIGVAAPLRVPLDAGVVHGTIRRGLEALAATRRAEGTDDNALEVFFPTLGGELRDNEQFSVAITGALAGVPADLSLKRVTVTAYTEMGMALYFNFYRSKAAGGQLMEERELRHIHPYHADLMELWRYRRHWRLEKVPTPWDNNFLFLAMERTPPDGKTPDRRLLAFSFVNELSEPTIDSEGRPAFPEVDLAFGQAVHTLRQPLEGIEGEDGLRTRLEGELQGAMAHRIHLVVRAGVTLGRDKIEKGVERLVPRVRGLGVEQTTLRLRRWRPSADIPFEELMLRAAAPGGTGLRIERVELASAPQGFVAPLTDADRYRRAAQQKRVVYPYDYLHELVTDRGFGAGEFQEFDVRDVGVRRGPDDRDRARYDLVTEGVRPLYERFPGDAAYKKAPKIVIGLLTRKTRRHPEGMTVVQIINDPTIGLCPLEEPECARIIAALDYAEAHGLEVDWKATSSGAGISMARGTENLDWTARVAARIGEFTEGGGVVNIIVDGTNIGAQSYWDSIATMLNTRRGVLIETPRSFTALTGNEAQAISGSVPAEDNIALAGANDVTGPIGETQILARDVADATRILWEHHDLTWRPPGEVLAPVWPTTDPEGRDVTQFVWKGAEEEWRVGKILGDEKKVTPFPVEALMEAIRDQDGPAPIPRWEPWAREGAGLVKVREAVVGGVSTLMIGIEARPLPREDEPPPGYPEIWYGSTLYPAGSKKMARAINAANGRQDVVIVANLSGFDGSAESLRRMQLEWGAEIEEAVRRFRGRIVFLVTTRYHGGAYVVFSRVLNPGMAVGATTGTFASVIGGRVAVQVISAFRKEVDKRAKAREATPEVQALLQAATTPEEKMKVRQKVRAEEEEKYAQEYDRTHCVERAQRVGSIEAIVPPNEVRPWIIGQLREGREVARGRTEVTIGHLTEALRLYFSQQGEVGIALWEGLVRAAGLGAYLSRMREAVAPPSLANLVAAQQSLPLEEAPRREAIVALDLDRLAELGGSRVQVLNLDLPAGQVGAMTYQFERVGSTMDVLTKLIGEEGPQRVALGTVVVADTQESGRGREGRVWESPPGRNLYLSTWVRPTLPPDKVTRLPHAVAAAVHQTVGEFSDQTPTIKWPNDVLLEGRKIAGILIDSALEGQGFVVGIGLNVNAQAEDFSPELRDQATSLYLGSGRTWDREFILMRLLQSLDDWLKRLERGEEGWGQIVAYVRAHSSLIGRRVRVRRGGMSLEGVVERIGDDASLIVRDGDHLDRIDSGDVTVI